MSFFVNILQAFCLVLAAFGLCAAAFALMIALPSWVFFSGMAFVAICAVVVMILLVVGDMDEYEDWEE